MLFVLIKWSYRSIPIMLMTEARMLYHILILQSNQFQTHGILEPYQLTLYSNIGVLVRQITE